MLTDRELLGLMAAIVCGDEPCYAVQKAQAILKDVDAALKPLQDLRDLQTELANPLAPLVGSLAPARCPRCSGTGILGYIQSQDPNLGPALESEIYCDCQTGKDLQKQRKTKFGV